MKKFLLLATAATFLLASCDKNDDKNGGIFKGPEKQFQHGKAWTWVQVDKDDKPLRIGIAIDDAAMNSLDPGEGHNGGHQHVNGISLAMHPKAGVTPFKHALLDWNPHGHEPAGVYDKAHFDFHFYLTSEAERNTIPPYEVDSAGFKNLPPAGYIPPMHTFGAPVPKMGLHWLDLTSPELNGQQFTQTFIYGSYNGNVNFYEPMITKAFLDVTTSFQRNFPVPAKFKTAGYYPTKMRIERKQGVTNVILEEFVYRQAS
jgi:hypothetical protein